MAITLRSVMLTAALLLGGLVAGALALSGADAAQGVIAGGMLMLGSLGLGAVLFRPGAPPAAVSMLTSVKLPLLGLGAFLLFRTFPVLSVVVGGSVVVVAATALALFSQARQQLLVET